METNYTLSVAEYAKQETDKAQEEVRYLISKAPTGSDNSTKVHVDDIWTWRQKDTFSRYFDTDSVPFTIMGFFALWAAISLIMFFGIEDCNIFLAIFAPLGGAIGIGILTGGAAIYAPVVVGLLLKLIVSPILYPIFKNKCKAWNDRYADTLPETKRELDERIAEYATGFEAAATEAAKMYGAHEVTAMISDKIAEGFISAIKAAKRTSDIKRLDIQYNFSVSKSWVLHSYNKTIKFEDYRCKPLANQFAITAYGYAVIDGVVARIRGELESDPSGSEYEITPEHSFDEKGILTVTLNYRAKNGNFEELSDWGAVGTSSGKE